MTKTIALWLRSEFISKSIQPALAFHDVAPARGLAPLSSGGHQSLHCALGARGNGSLR
jgi:hypothetical protein